VEQPSVDPETLLKLAKNLQSAHSRLTAGEARKWRDVPAAERTIWSRLARVAVRILLEQRAAPSAD
jgi:hypothetical protein